MNIKVKNYIHKVTLKFELTIKERWVQHTYTLHHGLLNRWTDIFILPRTPWGEAFNPNNATQTHSIFVKL